MRKQKENYDNGGNEASNSPPGAANPAERDICVFGSGRRPQENAVESNNSERNWISALTFARELHHELYGSRIGLRICKFRRWDV